jgi:uncharacterized protein (TIGR03435 family)
MWRGLFLIACAALSTALLAQTAPLPTNLPTEFEVASVKLHQPGVQTDGGVAINLPGRYGYNGVGLPLLVAPAYEVLGRVVTGPGYPKEVDEHLFDLDTKTGLPPAGRYETMRMVEPMLQHLLAERFKLVVHREQRETRHCILVQAQGGHKLTPSKRATDTNRIDPALSVAHGVYYFKGFPMYGALNILTGLAGTPVLDQTALGWQQFDFSIELVTADGERLSIFQAIQPLGLRLEERKGPVEYLVIDHAEMPTPN